MRLWVSSLNLLAKPPCCAKPSVAQTPNAAQPARFRAPELLIISGPATATLWQNRDRAKIRQTAGVA
jgi:hypothetical protein